MKITTILLLTLIGALLSGCITLSQEMVEVDTRATNSTHAAEHTHISSIINELYDLIEEEVKQIFYEEYAKPYIIQALDSLDSDYFALPNEKKEAYILAIKEKIQENKEKILQLIQEARDNVIQDIMQAYHIPNVSLNIWGVPRSAAEVDIITQEILKKIGLNRANFFIQTRTNLVDQAKEKIENLINDNLKKQHND